MDSKVYTGVGTLSNPQTVVLDRPLTLPLGRVHVVVQVLSTESTESPWLDKLEEIHQALRQSSYHFRSREEIDAQIQNERDRWERLEFYHRLSANGFAVIDYAAEDMADEAQTSRELATQAMA